MRFKMLMASTYIIAYLRAFFPNLLDRRLNKNTRYGPNASHSSIARCFARVPVLSSTAMNRGWYTSP